MKTKLRSGLAARCVRRLLLAWLTAATTEFLLLPHDLTGLEGIAQMSLLRVLVLTAVVFLLLWVFRGEKAERWAIAGVFALLAVTTLVCSFTWPLLGACLLIFAVLVVYALRGWEGSEPPRPKPGRERRICRILTAILALLFFLFVSIWTVCRVYSFSTPTYDFGIFSQMFYSMKTTGLPTTTVERDGALSHFAVHMSPIYYLLLPFYCLAPTPATLQVLQAAVLASAVIPLWKLGRLHGLPDWQRLLLCAILLLYPAYSGGTSYDIHENCFLTPLLLWLFYGIDRKNGWLTAIAAVLTLTVKEDAAVYVAVVGLWLGVRALLRRDSRGLLTGGLLLAGAVGWFFAVTGYLAQSGDGVMTYRYQNFIYDGSGSLLTVIKAVLLCPMKAVFESVDPDKLPFIALTLLPLLGLPLLTRRFERYILLIPYVLVNLMSDYVYQHDIFFQYTFGSTACLCYLTLVNLADWKPDWRRLMALVGAVGISAGCFGAVVVPRAVWYPASCVQYSGYYAQLRDTLSLIPEYASVTATTFYTTFLSQRETLYDVGYASKEHLLSTDYVVLNLSAEDSCKKYAASGKSGVEGLIALLERNGYELYAQVENVMVIYRAAP